MQQRCVFQEFSRYTLFSVLGTLGVSCYVLADTFFVSKALGASGLAALNLAIPIYNFIHGTGLMLGMGGATKFSVCNSQGRQELVNKIYTNTLCLALVFSALFLLTGLFCSQRLSLLLGADAGILGMTSIYLRWLLLFSPAFILNDVLLCFVRNDEGPQLAMAAMLTGSFANILLDYIFIFPLNMGIFGAIFATGLSPLISISIMALHWIQKKNSFHLIRTGLSPHIVKWDLSLGFPSLLAQLSSGVVMITFNGIILSLEGNTGVAAYGIIANLSLVAVAVYTGVAQGIQPLVSRFYGTGDRRQIQSVLKYAMTATLTLSGILYLVIFLFAQPIAAVFNSEHHAGLQAIAVTGLKLYFISAPFMGCNIILATFFTSIEHPLPAHILSVLRGFVLIIPAAFLLSFLWHMTGVWLAYPVTEGITALLGAVIYQNHRKGNENYES